jgi:hypothetical protein
LIEGHLQPVRLHTYLAISSILGTLIYQTNLVFMCNINTIVCVGGLVFTDGIVKKEELQLDINMTI